MTTVREQRFLAEFNSPTIAVGGDFEIEGKFHDLNGDDVEFTGLEILQVEFDAAGLAATDTVTLSLYRGPLRSNEELVARYSAVSAITGAWKSIQSNQLIQYFDRSGDHQIYGLITNAAGNSARCIFHVLITARPAV